MIPSQTLVIDDGRGSEQVIRAPRSTDAIGGSLRAAFATQPRLPDDLRSLLHLIDRAADRPQ